ncbi:MAG: hypothetical protein IJX49_04080 [Clostridia bacterium]|nr:hypothetical protein [Clostridia bacterium]
MFCKMCGKELAEGAYVCTGCGRLVKEGNKATPKSVSDEVALEERTKRNILLKAFLIGSFALVGIIMIFLVLSFAMSEQYINLTMQNNTYNIRFSDYVELELEPGSCCLMFITSIVNVGVAVTAFILGIKEKERLIKYASVLNFVFSIILILMSAILFGISLENF